MIKLLDNEKIIMIKRRHWVVIAAEGFFLFISAIAPFMVLIFLFLFSQSATDILIKYVSFLVFYLIAWIQLLFIIFFISWTNYYLDVLVITDKRVIDIEQIGFFARDMAEIRLDNIQDIKVEVLGFIATLLKVGNLHIQTAGQSKEIYLKNIVHPEEIKNLISKYHDEISKNRPVA